MNTTKESRAQLQHDIETFALTYREIALAAAPLFADVNTLEAEKESWQKAAVETAEQLASARELLTRISQWDALDIPNSDGPYWKREILREINAHPTKG